MAPAGRRRYGMSKAARISGAVLLIVVLATVFGGWRLYELSTQKAPSTLSQQLIAALNARDYSSAARLIDEGANVNYATPYSGETSLMAAAAASGNVAIIQRLLRNGAD